MIAGHFLNLSRTHFRFLGAIHIKGGKLSEFKVGSDQVMKIPAVIVKSEVLIINFIFTYTLENFLEF